MDSLLNHIAEKITRRYRNLSVISNPDGFLCREDTIRAFSEQTNIILKPMTQLELRVWYETQYQDLGDKKMVAILDSTQKLIADIRLNAFITEFKTRDLLLTYNQQAIDLNKMNYQMLAHLFENKSVAILDIQKTSLVVEEAETMYGEDGEDISVVKENLMRIVIDWHRPHDTIEQIAQQIVKAAKQGKYDEIETEIEFINHSFQKHLDNVYFQQLIPSAGPRVVHKILPYIARTYGAGQKVALIVVDGLSYWQYIILREALNNVGIETQDNVCYAWIPSVTQLSRQAIFRGLAPERAYKQNKNNEEKLWNQFWLDRNFQEWHVMYAHESVPEIPESIERLAFVTMTMDDDMHSAHNIKQLYRDTEDWAKSFVLTIQQILNAGFEIILTADHGGVPSYAWGNLSTQEKAALYETGSRGQRHLIFNNLSTMQHFMDAHPEDLHDWMIHGDNIVWRKNKCFGSSDCISHGGSHMMEMLVPLITIRH